MADKKDINDVIKEKCFGNFWGCFEYLMLAGYPQLECLSLTLKEFGEDNIFKKVAFARLNPTPTTVVTSYQVDMGEPPVISDTDPINYDTDAVVTFDSKGNVSIVIGIIDDDNIHLDGLYATYREWWINGSFDSPQQEIENTCKTITLVGLSPFIMDFLGKNSEKFYGYNVMVDMGIEQKRKLEADDIRNAINSLRGGDFR